MLAVDPARGLWCEAGGFHIDPWAPSDRALITHAHADHARWGSRAYLAVEPCVPLLRARLGPDAVIEGVPWGRSVTIGAARVSFHPAGHMLGSAQIRVEVNGEVWVVSGDYKIEPDPTCAAFEPVRCHTFITESTFGLPVYRWEPQAAVFAGINDWWRANAAHGKSSVLYGYALGKAQRLMAGLEASIGPLYLHGAVDRIARIYCDAGVSLPEWKAPGDSHDFAGAMIVAPPSAHGTPWLRRFGDVSTAFASGWMRIRGPRRRRAVDRGFVLSDHADWPGLLSAIGATGADRVLVTHGYRAPLARWLREQGKDAGSLETHFEGERDDLEVAEEAPE